MSDHLRKRLIMWSVLYACFADENQRRADRGQLPLPLPTSISQLEPYASLCGASPIGSHPRLTSQGHLRFRSKWSRPLLTISLG
jgi:hypothetical protein